jgi:hypothetical protein
MKVQWVGLGAVMLAASAIIAYKTQVLPQAQAADAALPRVLLLAEPSEADNAGDSCAEIIHLVRAARDRGVAVQEFGPASKSELLARYHLVIVPTVLILDSNGKEISRYEGEGRDTVKAVRASLEQLK